MKTKLDRYSLLIISKYFNTPDDFINVMLTNKKFEDLVGMFHFNPISINNSSKKLFTNIETQHIYNKLDEILPSLFNYIVWYRSDDRTIEYFDKIYHIRPIFKKLSVGLNFIKSGNKKNGDLLFVRNHSGQGIEEETIDLFEYIGIEESSFNYSQIKEIKLGKHVNSIPSYSFQYCSLNSIDLSFVTRMDGYAFGECTDLTSITLSKHLEIMDINCFMGCSSLKTISISDNSKEFKLDLSYELYKIMKGNGILCTGNIWIKNDEEIPTDVDCKIIKIKELLSQEIVKFDSIQIIPSYFHIYSTEGNIKQIILSPNVVSTNRMSFYNIKSLESINLENVKQIKHFCFMNGIKLKEINISNTTYLGCKAFYGCKNLTSVTYSTKLNYIPEYCFYDCQNLKEIKGIESVTRIGPNCFKKCPKLSISDLPKNLIRIEESNGSRFKIKSIDNNCSILYFARGCFKGNTTLESIHIAKNNFFKKIIGDKAFLFCTSLKEVKLEGIKNLNYQSFKDCYSLSTIELPSSLKIIGRYCFENCWSLKEIRIPSSVELIEKGALLSCESLTKVEFGNGKVKISPVVFNHCPLKEINLLNGNKMKGCFSYEHYLMLKLKGIDVTRVEYTRSDRRKYGNIIPECCCGIGDRTFEGCSMKEFTIPLNIKKFGYKCFNKCRNLNKIYMTSELKKSVTVGVNCHFTRAEPIFCAIIRFTKNCFGDSLLFEKIQKDDKHPIEIIEI